MRNQASTPIVVGRAAETRRFHACVQDVLSGTGTLALVGGEAGIGKTTLINAVAREAEAQGILVLSGYCLDGGSTPPYGPWLDLLSGYRPVDDLPDIPASLAIDANRQSLRSQDELLALIQHFFDNVSSVQPVMLLLEDLHWTDAASLDVLRSMSRGLHQQPMLIVVTYRDDELSRGHPLYLAIPALVHDAGAIRIPLRRLDDVSTRSLIRARYRLTANDESVLVEHFHRLAEGNPFFIQEILSDLEESGILLESEAGWTLTSLTGSRVPPLIQQVIDGRLARLEPRIQGLLEIAAVIGQEVPLDLWRRISGCSQDEMIEVVGRAIDARWMEEAGERAGLRFSHALVREALYRRVVLPRRLLLHLKIAEALSQSPATDPDTVAYHFSRADDPRALDWLVRAAERAQRLYANGNVIELLNSASGLAEQQAVALPALAHRIRGQAWRLIGNFDAARSDLEQALERARQDGNAATEWQALIDLGMLWAERDYEQTGALFRLALERATSIGERDMLAHSLNRVGNWHLNLDQPLEAIEYHQQALGIFQSLGDRRGSAETLDLLGITNILSGNLSEGTRHYRSAMTLFQELDDRESMASCLSLLTLRGATYQTDTMIVDDATLAVCAADGERALEIARDIGWRAGEAFALAMLCFCVGSMGRYRRALEYGHESIRIAAEIGHQQWSVAANCAVGAVYLDALDLKTARSFFDIARSLAEGTGSGHWRGTSAALLALTAIQQGDLDTAEAVLDVVNTSDMPARTLAQRLTLRARVELLLARGEAQSALDALDHMESFHSATDTGRTSLRAAMLRGDALIACSRHFEAVTSYEAARSIATAQGALPVLWRSHLALGKLAMAGGDRAGGREHLDAARSIVASIANETADDGLREAFTERTDRLIPSTERLTPLQLAKREYDGLTARQRDVAALIALGHSNRAIANALSLSERTIESHVTSILTTLNFSARSQIAVWAAEKGLTAERSG